MTLAFAARHRQGDFHLDAQFEVGRGLTVLFGPSGSGKTTIVDLIAGLRRPDSGRIVVDGAVLLDTSAGVFVPPHRRKLGLVFQDARLFPHLSVRQNLLYGRWFAGLSRERSAYGGVVDLLGLGGLIDRAPATLSGGERQRVAMGRALLAEPRLLLMDEPLASLDERRRREIIPYLERLRDEAGLPIVYISHSLWEVTRLATTVVAIADGRVIASGAPSAVLQAAVFDANREGPGSLIEARVVGQEDRFALTRLASAWGEWLVPGIEAPEGSALRLWVRASDVMIARRRPADVSALNVFAARVVEITSRNGGSSALVALQCGGDRLMAQLTRYSVERLGLVVGQDVFALIKSVAIDQR